MNDLANLVDSAWSPIDLRGADRALLGALLDCCKEGPMNEAGPEKARLQASGARREVLHDLNLQRAEVDELHLARLAAGWPGACNQTLIRKGVLWPSVKRETFR